MSTMLQDLIDFHRKFGHPVGMTPSVPDDATVALRQKLIDEEYGELMEAIGVDDIPAIAKEGIDLIYVVVGLFVAYGIDPSPLWIAVHSSNMAKTGGKDATGKTMKGPNYRAPDIAGLLAKQRPLTAGVEL